MLIVLFVIFVNVSFLIDIVCRIIIIYFKCSCEFENGNLMFNNLCFFYVYF